MWQESTNWQEQWPPQSRRWHELESWFQVEGPEQGQPWPSRLTRGALRPVQTVMCERHPLVHQGVRHRNFLRRE